MKRVKLFYSMLLPFALLAAPDICAGAQQAAAVLEDGYAGNVLQKILATEKVQPVHSGSIKLYLDDEGRLGDCRKIKGNDTQALCAAAKAASPFGKPPYGISTNVVITFWTSGKDTMAKPAAGSDAKHETAQADKSYISRITRELRNAIYIPQETRKGVYHATVQLSLAKNGHIEKSSILKSSGDARLDRYIMQGLARAGKVTAPPASLKNPVELTFTFKR